MHHHGDDVCGASCVCGDGTFCTISSGGNLQSGSFLFPPESFLLPPELSRTQIGVELLREGGGIRCNVIYKQSLSKYSTSLLLTMTTQVVLKILLSRVILEVASRVMIVTVAEVAVTDSVNVAGVPDAFNVNLALIDQFL